MPRAKDVMSTRLVAMAPSAALRDATARMAADDVGAVVAIEGDAPVGLFSERDLLRRVVNPGLDVAALRLGDVMTRQLHVARADDDIDVVFDMMRERRIRHVPIVDAGRLVGMISVRDLLTARHRPIHQTHVGTWMTHEPRTARAGDPVQAVVEDMVARRIGAVVVVEERRVTGIFTERDLLNRVTGARRDPRTTTIGEVMTPDPTVARLEDEFETVYRTMLALNVRHLPIVDRGALVGIVSIRDVFRMRERILERIVDEKNDLVVQYQDLLERSPDERINHLMFETERLKAQSITDELTGLYNYRHFVDRLAGEIDRAQRYSHPLSLVICDVDDFKIVNDTHGHLAGDSVLRDFAALLARSFDSFDILSSFRRSDLIARYGGEEFVALLVETDAAGARVAAERVRKAVAEFPFLRTTLERPLRLTLSMGIATYPTHTTDAEQVLRLADQALYTAKRTGKNRVVVFGDP